jgi:small subunit ribosomal protein S6
MTNTYEMMFILRPDLNQEQINKQMHKYHDLLKDQGAEKLSMEVWGKRRLAYPIQNYNEGIYILTYYTGDGSQVAVIERDMRLSEEVMRYLTIKHKQNFEFEEKEIPAVEAIPVSSPQPQPILAQDIPTNEKETVETTTADSVSETIEDDINTEETEEADNQEPATVEA